MRISFIPLVTALCLAGTATAQTAPRAQTPARQNIIARITRVSLRGIALSDAEKTKLQAVRPSYAPRFTALRGTVRADFTALRTARQNKDTAAARAARVALRADRGRIAGTIPEYLQALRASLTAEHQTQFDANRARARRMLRQWRQQQPTGR